MFDNPQLDYRALRDMGLAAWWGSSLMGLSGLVKASETETSPAAQHRILDAGWRGSRGLMAGAVTAYVLGISYVRFEGEPFDGYTPKWISEGVESGSRTGVLVGALGAAIAARRLRDKEGEIYQRPVPDLAEAAKLRKQANLLHAVVPAAVGWLMFSHLREDMS